MKNAPSSTSSIRRDEAWLVKYRNEMKFSYSGPFVTLLGKAPRVKTARDLAGKPLDPQPAYSCATPAMTVERRVPVATARALEAAFSRERNSVLEASA